MQSIKFFVFRKIKKFFITFAWEGVAFKNSALGFEYITASFGQIIKVLSPEIVPHEVVKS